MRFRLSRSAHVLTLCVVGAGVGTGCAPQNTFAPPPPPKVTVQTPIVRDLQTYLTATGETQAFQSVEIRARVRGFLEKIAYAPGQQVEAESLLFVIDERPYAATVGLAEADLASANADLGLAETNLQKLESVTSGAVSEIAKIEARARREVALAAVAAAESRLRSARLDQSYCRVIAPIAGRVSANLRDVGNLVGANDATLLATIIDDSKIYAWFHISEQDLLRAKQHYADQGRERRDVRGIPCELARMTDEGYPLRGELDYNDPGLDPETGTLRIRAIFDNSDHRLAPGLFVRVRVPMQAVRGAILVPERALGADPQGSYILVVSDQGIVERRNVVRGERDGELVHVRSGLEPNERVIVNGLQRARPGAPVDAMTAEQQALPQQKPAALRQGQ